MLVRQWVTSRSDHYNSLCMLRDDQINRRLSAASQYQPELSGTRFGSFLPEEIPRYLRTPCCSNHIIYHRTIIHNILTAFHTVNFYMIVRRWMGWLALHLLVRKEKPRRGKILQQLFINVELINCKH